jgi:hypothetical protein
MIKKFLSASFFLLLICNYSFAQQTIPKDTLIIFEPNPGFFAFMSPCPFYKMTIFADGVVELEPKYYKNENEQSKLVTGEIIKSKITEDEVKELISEFEKIDFYSLKDKYDTGMDNSFDHCPIYLTDSSKAIISFTSNGRTKKVEHDHGCSGTTVLYKLTNLENKIAKTVNIQKWLDCKM